MVILGVVPVVQLPRIALSLDVEPGQTILEAALAAAVPYPHGCRAGNCGACKSRLLAGETDLMPYSEYALTESERAEGLILACRATPWEDCSVAWLESEEVVAHPVVRLPCHVTKIEMVATATMRVRLTADEATEWLFSAGQYAEVAFAGQPPRNFSMANAPSHAAGPATFEFHIRLLPDGQVSGFVRDQLRVGDRVEVRGPFGSCHLRAGHTGPLLLIAGGTGLAPIVSIARASLGERPTRPIFVYFGVRNASFVYGVYGKSELADLAAEHPALSVNVALSEASDPAGPARLGFLHDIVRQDLDSGRLALDGAKAYVAGPPPMVDAVRAVLLDHQLPAADLHADAFFTVAEQQARALTNPPSGGTSI